MSYVIIILICAHYLVSDQAGKYQNGFMSANAICKYVTGFSFIVFLAALNVRLIMLKKQKYCF